MSHPAPRQLVVTSALPYANGPIHIGHLVEYIQTDIWVRFQRLAGNRAVYVCADDAHGTPIMLKADAEGISPEALIARVRAEHERDFADFLVEFDNYHSTHSPENREISGRIFSRLEAGGYIASRDIEQAFDPEKSMFLPDRFIRGTCPNCGAEDQYGDGCEVCSATYTPADLVNPVSAVSGATPVTKTSEHLFFRLGAFEEALKAWMDDSGLNPFARNKLMEWFEAGLKDWDISRDAPYFGFEIPGHPGKFFYVWLDAPIGYFASLKAYCEREGLDFEAMVAEDADVELHHFIGKDILYFHTLFWPAMLTGAGMKRPDAVHVHGFLTVDGKKMSKTRGTFITARTFLDHLNPEYLRYYLAAKLGPDLDDIDLNLEDFRNRVNADLVGKYVNIASRSAKFVETRFDGRLGPRVDEAVLDPLKSARASIAAAYEGLDYARAVREVMALADSLNQYIDRNKPWVIAKEAGATAELAEICTTALNGFRILTIYLKPVLPRVAAAVERLFGAAGWTLADVDATVTEVPLAPYEPLMQRVDPKAVAAMVEASKPDLEPARPGGAAAAPADAPADAGDSRPTIGIEAFSKIELKVGRVLDAQPVDGADKLLQLTIDVGESRPRNVFAGIKAAYAPETLVDRLVVVVANLEPRKMRFGVSEGMVLAAGPGGEDVFVLSPDAGAAPGMPVK